MKIAIPTSGNKGLDDSVSEHFGRAPAFTIIDSDTMDFRVIENTSEHMGGIGKPPEIMKKEGVDIMICSALGFRAIKMFENLGIEVFVGAHGTVREAIEMWKRGKLQRATYEHGCRGHKH
ncbi:MAG: dinitrogenase iron-molybdenum cofactor biosynthesis protein [Candidatus Altiarchaeales archaeon]|nr:MAG: dinitrogenase iron-molybdenum cofactor biosynthesis protein [Candidatus Altiarchaeales archaeon]RLI93674.1 MAG: dinitrogenase iron-molybdenum cofactor biosynthesis protein [Candidatus Altiarchaeales archaeon]HDO81965.1 dinitrogenase iron-molybdenum cofactor biosynthesis protein [Candidatus Altiarchaeales archaeon]HEX54614.1 dinitrogenase iron-molybdenum cofactor biosynthesis protein [Candidatus Altiarchaeales archaeon]